MSSTAFSAQGSTLKIGSTGVTSIPAAITKANPPVVTDVAHGLANGDIVLFAGITGMVEINGKYGCVLVQTTSKYATYGIDSTSFTTFTTGGTPTATQAQVALGNWKSFSGFNGQRSDIDVTNLASTDMEFLGGLQDNGTFDFGFHIDDTDAGQMAFLANRAAPGLTSRFVLTFPNSKTRTFRGYVKSMPEQGGVNAAVEGNGSIKISGAVARG